MTFSSSAAQSTSSWSRCGHAPCVSSRASPANFLASRIRCQSFLQVLRGAYYLLVTENDKAGLRDALLSIIRERSATTWQAGALSLRLDERGCTAGSMEWV